MARRVIGSALTALLFVVLAGLEPVHLDGAQASRVVRRCSEPKACAPRSSGTLIIYVRDPEGASIADAEISVEPGVFQGPPNRRLGSVRTDWYGMAAISVEPSLQYRIRVRHEGWRDAEIPPVSVPSGEVEALSVRMELDLKRLLK